MPDRLHEVGLAHSNAAIQEERVICLGRSLRHRPAGRMRKLVSAANHESIKRVPRIELRRSIPIEARLRRRRTPAEPAVMPHRRRRRIIFRRHKLHFIESQPEHVHRFLNQIRVFISRVAELHRRHAHKQNAAAGMAVARWLQPRVVGVPVDFLFQRIENAGPWIGGERCA